MLLSTGNTIGFIKSSENKASYVPMARREVAAGVASKFAAPTLFFFLDALIFCNLPV